VLIKNSYYRTVWRAVLNIIETANKTLFSLASAGVCLLSLYLLFAPAVLAQTPAVSVGSPSGLAGTAVDVPVSFTAGATGVSTLQFDLTLPSQLSYVSVTTGSAATAAGKSASGSTISGGVRILIFGLNQTAIGSGQVAVVRLNISASASGTLPVAISGIVASDSNGNPVNTSGSGGSVVVTAPVLPTVTISATDPNASETGPDTGTFTVSRTGSTGAALTVNYTVGGTATSGSDYSALAGSVTIPSGSASATITVTPVDDTTVESSETVIATLSSGASYTVGSPGNATVTIADNNTLPTVTISATDPNASEMGPDSGTFTVSRTGSTSAALTANYSVGGTATSGSDYSALAGSVTIPSGSASTTIMLTPVDDAVVEGSETVIVTLSIDASYTVGSPNSATVTIADNNTLPTVTISATDPNASETGPDTGTFTVSRTGSTSEALTVNYTVGGTASSSDYSSLAGSVTIPAGSVSATITVTPVQDTTPESPETVTVSLSSDASRTVGSPNSATVTISDSGDAGPVLLSLSTNRGATGAPVVIIGTGFGITQGSSRVTFNGTPSPISSWSTTSITATVPEGSTSGPVVVTVNRSSNGINFKVNGKLWPPGRPRIKE
jgi:Tfp pilus assembly protein PilE